MATIVQAVVRSIASSGQTSFGTPALDQTPVSGNLLVLFYGARDSDNNETPVFPMPEGWTKAAEASPMEFHSVGIAFKTSEGDELGATITPDSAVQATWIGLVEYNEAGVSSWALDKSSADGSGATNVSSIASGSTGTLGSSTGVAAIAGTSRTGSEDLSTDTGASLSSEDAGFEVDAGAANFIAAWLDLAATTALDATISESSGSSRMGAAIATFIEAGGGGANVPVNQAIESEQVNSVTPLLDRQVSVGQTTEAETAQPITPALVRQVTVNPATEAETANPITPLINRNVTLGQAAETETANPVTPSLDRQVTLGQAVESETAGTINPVGANEVTITRAAEAETAQPITPATDREVVVGQASEAETAGTITPVIGRLVPIGTATEAETGNTLTPLVGRTILIGVATEVELARLISPSQPRFVTLQTAVERELARVMTPRIGDPVVLGPVICEVLTPTATCAILSPTANCEIVNV